MTEDNDLDRVEQMLRSVPPPIDVPGHLEGHARAAAMGEDVIRPVERSVRMRRGRIRFRLLPAAAVLATAVAASLVLGVGGRSPGIRVTHACTAPATTLHAYSPPLRRMGAYLVQPGGALERHPLAKNQELRPLTPVA